MLRFLACAMGVGAIAVLSSGGFVRAASAPVEPGRVRVSVGLLDEVVRGLLPVDVVVPAVPSPNGTADAGAAAPALAAALTELRYCGITDKGAGRFRAVIRWGRLGNLTPLLDGEDRCQQSLNELARQRPVEGSPDDGVATAELEATWRPWELRLVVARIGGPAPPKPGQPGPLGTALLAATLEGRRELVSVSTAGLRVMTDAGEPLSFHVAPAFASDALELAAVWGDTGPAAPARAAGTPSVGAGNANLWLDLPYSLANQVLRRVAGEQHPLAIPVDRDVVDVQSVAVTAAGGAATNTGSAVQVTGLATPRSLRETVRLTAQAAGDELRVQWIRAEAQLENCGPLGALAAIGCNARNAARNGAAAAFAAALTQKYQGQVVRDLAGQKELQIEMGARRLALRGDVVHAAAGPRGLSLSARLGSAVDGR